MGHKTIELPPRTSDEGTYECRATPRRDSPDAEPKTISYRVVVLEMVAPDKGEFFNLGDNDLTFNTGDSLDLNCTVAPDARPRPTINWTKDGNSSFLEDDSIKWSNGLQRMQIKYLVHVHSGLYKCEVESRGAIQFLPENIT